ncbi:MAG: hypothetical protein JW724_08135 [Candidatus Altiarchaeota archaeon]|nr:hypothetical protein [Candidatus Altiarchaeota archaeon]
MEKDIRLLFEPKSRDYIVVSDGHTLRMSEEEFNSIKCTMNGIALALCEKARERKKAAAEAERSREDTGCITPPQTSLQTLKTEL